MRSKLTLVVAASVFVLTVLSVACGGGDNESNTSPTATLASARSEASPAATATLAATATQAAPAATSTTAPPAGSAPTNTPQPSATTAPSSVSVTIVNFEFQPKTLSGKVGQALTVNLQNNGSATHSFTITGLVDSSPLGGGTSKSVTFTPAQAGTLTYFCTVHGQGTMSGTITVAP